MTSLFKRRKPNRSSIKEAMDTLPIGICYFSGSGMIKLCNKQMFRLYHMMTGRDLQNLAELRETLSGEDIRTEVIRLPESGQLYLFPDGKVWKYHENMVAAGDGNTYTEARFTDVTELRERQLELEEQVKRLKQMNGKIRKLSENAATAAKEREILAAKTRLHAQMGENLTVLRQTFSVPDSAKTQETAVQAMLRTVQFLMTERDTDETDAGFEEFLKLAANSGVEVRMEGILPKKQEAREVFMIAIRECLTNSVRHGEADQLWIAISEEKNRVICKITNNGILPKTEVIPGGGLKNLQHHVENCNGSMMICTEPFFSLTVILPDREEKKS